MLLMVHFQCVDLCKKDAQEYKYTHIYIYLSKIIISLNAPHHNYLPSVDDGDAELEDLCDPELELFDPPAMFADLMDEAAFETALATSPGEELYPASLPLFALARDSS